MRIQQLELVGFKSFVDRTVLNFSAGISAIVGPNGCGKSNVVDAIRWVLGEQSPKHLRGTAMEDVIFNGNERRAPLGMAEVSLTFQNDPESAPASIDPDLDVSTVPAHVRGLPEITVTRRYFRSGESEYCINRTPCRLKDITELFLGTGVGSKAYAIIEQGRVEQLINAKPEERRWFIEEAAGTTLYRSRKQAAERKMERTRENLLRVTDILREVERQIQYLNRQAKKAEQYRALQAEIRTLELALAGAQWRALTAEATALRESLAQLSQDAERLGAELQESEAVRVAAHERVSELEHELSALRETAARAGAELENARQRAVWLRQEIGERERRRERLAEEGSFLTGRVELLDRDAAEIARERHDYAARLAVDEAELQAKVEAVEQHRRIAAETDAQAEATKDRLVGVLAREAETRNQLAGLQRRSEDAQRRVERLSAEQQQATEGLQAVDAQLVTQRERLAALRERLRELQGERETRSQRLRELADDKRQMERRASAAQEQLLQLRSRLRSLEDIQRNYEGYQRGVRSVMLRDQPAEGVLGVVADVISAPREHERAVAAVLGDRLQYVIVNAEEQGLGAVQALRAEDSGRGSFIPRQPRRIPLNANGVSLNGNTARLLDLVRVEDGYQDIAETLLGDVVLVPDLLTALTLWRRNGIHVTMVTPDGDVLDASGVITGGSDRPMEEEILGRRREIQELEISIAAAGADLERATAELDRLATVQATEDAALRELDAGVHELTLSALSGEKDCERLEADRPRLAERIEVSRFEIEATQQEAAEITREVAVLGGQLQALDSERSAQEADLQARQQECGRVRGEVDALVEDLSAARVRFAERRERQQSLAARADEITRQQEELRQRRERLDTEERETAAERDSLLSSAVAADEVVEAAEQRTRELAADIARTVAQVEAAGAAADTRDAVVARLRDDIDQCRSARMNQETTVAEKRVRLEHLESSMREKYAVDLAADAAAAGDVELDPETASRLDYARERLQRVGEVNVGAIEELQELQGRGQFLRTQKEDLERSLADLERTIGKLNRASRARFQETFQQVDEKFRAIFPRLFRGGEAHLVLTDEHNILESGVEIFVRPPGKKLDTVTLLSGGEKALVAVSLIFSLFLISPTPFCFLDEIDAPLDDANVGRFVQMVRELRERSQFIMITHNKRTMEAADCLYGITMEEPGVSKVISVAMR